MKKFVKTMLIFLIPFAALAGIIAAVDPYGLLRPNNDPAARQACYSQDHGRLSYTIDFMRQRPSKIILGASQPNIIDVSHIPSPGWAKLCFGGAKVQEYVKAFWLGAANAQLDSVVLMLDPYAYAYSAGRDDSGYAEAYDICTTSPVKYFVSPNVWRASWQMLMHNLGIGGEPQPVTATDSAYWEAELQRASGLFQGKLSSQAMDRGLKQLSQSLRDVKAYCDSASIAIVAAQPIAHGDLQRIYDEEGAAVTAAFNRDMAEIFGGAVDVGSDSAYVWDRSNFRDPLHTRSDSLYIRSIWKKGG